MISDRYTIEKFLPNLQIVGPRGWDDFIVRDLAGNTFTVGTVPLLAKYLSPNVLPAAGSILCSDERFLGKIKVPGCFVRSR